MPADPPPPIARCRNPRCRYAFGPVGDDRGRVSLTLGGQAVVVPAGSMIFLPCPDCGELRSFAGSPWMQTERIG